MNQSDIKIKIAYLFCGSGLGAMGFGMSQGEHKGIVGTFKNLGGIDNDPLCCEDFEYLTGAPAHNVDLFDRQQYTDFFGHEPPDDWHECTGKDLRDVFKERPDVLFLSPPCKGFSGLLSEKNSQSKKYQALNRLTIRSMQLSMDAWGDDPPAFILIENVPRIKSRGRKFINEIRELLSMYGYVFTYSDHDCGELGGLGQHRKRFLLVARQPKKAPSFLYQPPKRPLKSIGDVIGELPMPGDTQRGGPLHRIPNLQFKTWLRLAIIPAGGDWRDLNKKCYANIYQVVPFDEPSTAVTGAANPSNGAVSIADPKLNYSGRSGTFRLLRWDKPTPAVTGNTGTGRSNSISGVADPRNYYHGAYKVTPYDETSGTVTSAHGPTCSGSAAAVADPRVKFNHCYKVTPYDEAAGAVASGTGPTSGATMVADPRIAEWDGKHSNSYKVQDFDQPSNTVLGATDIQAGALSVADTRGGSYGNNYHISEYDEPSPAVIASRVGSGAVLVADPRADKEGWRENWKAGADGRIAEWDKPSDTVLGYAGVRSAGASSVADVRYSEGHRSDILGVMPYDQPAKTVLGASDVHKGCAAVADPRIPKDNESGIWVIISEDGTWHRPLTTLELAALQGMPMIHNGQPLKLAGNSEATWREHIGNGVPLQTAQAIGDQILATLLPNIMGDWHWDLDDNLIWVKGYREIGNLQMQN